MSSSSPDPFSHQPVLLKEVLMLLSPKPGQVVVDGTLGSGGHAGEILRSLGPTGRLIGIDQDPAALQRAQKKLSPFPNVSYVPSNFSQIPQILSRLNLSAVDAVLLDVGVSSEQLEDSRRGFSFLKEGPLDMRMDPTGSIRAKDLINDLSEEELTKLFREYGEERWAQRIARVICRERGQSGIETTRQLAEVIQKAVPPAYRYGRQHPAMRVFQAIRIRVNGELEALKSALPGAWEVLRRSGRLAVISFHSLEDRIVKQTFREWAKQGRVQDLTRKPFRPTKDEVERNPRARSAKLRAVEKL